MRSRFATGTLFTAADVLDNVPRATFISALKDHVLAARPLVDGQAVRSEHRHGPVAFRIETAPDRMSTTVSLC